MSYTELELNSLIADVEREFTSHLAKAEKSFSKGEFPPKKEEPKDEDKQPDQKKVNGAAEDKKDSAKDEKTNASEEKSGEQADASKGSKPMEGESEGDKGVKDQHQQEAGAKEGQADESHGYDEEDMAHMHSMYSSMSKPELKAHHDVIRKCMDGMSKMGMGEDMNKMGMAEGMAKAEMEDGAKDAEGYRPNGGPHDGEAASKKTAPSSDMTALEKSEKNIVLSEVTLLKSELETAKAERAAVAEFLKKFIEKTAPAGKAITSLDIIAKTEGANSEKPLSKSEIHEKLLAKSKDLSLAKSDRDAINSYYFSKNVETVRHLLK